MATNVTTGTSGSDSLTGTAGEDSILVETLSVQLAGMLA
jgi:hypothetical protein